MKKTILFTFVLLLVCHVVNACIGGCTFSGSATCILPHVKKDNLGVRYLSNSFTVSTLRSNSDALPAVHDKQEYHFNTAELWGRITPVKKMFLFVTVPYRFNTQTGSTGTVRSSGPGDATIAVNYAFINLTDSTHTTKHVLRFGGGIKLPTGSSAPKQGLTLNMLPGTGSIDYLLTCNYVFRYQQVGFITEAGYVFTSLNKRDYEFGNKLAGSANLFYWQNIGKLTVLPSAGITYEHVARDEVKSIENFRTGGESVYSNLALNLYTDHFFLSANWQKNLSTTTVRNSKDNHRTGINLAYLF